MLTIITGFMGSGKTLFLTLIASFSTKKIIANYKLKEIPYEPFNLNKFTECEYENCTLLIDEAYLFMDSRNSMATQNKLSSYVLFQSRKKNVDLYIAVQLGSSLDTRYRDLSDYLIYAEKKNGEFYYAVRKSGATTPVFINLKQEKAQELFLKFDTMELVNPNVHKKEKIETAKAIAVDICAKFPNSIITKAIVKNWIYEHNHSSDMIDLTYGYIKEKEAKKKGKK